MSPPRWARPWPPQTFEEACRVKEEVAELTRQALAETDFARLDLLPHAQAHFKAEARRWVTEMPPVFFTPKELETLKQTKRRERT